MIPRTYPCTYLTANGKQQMDVYFLSSVTGLERWKDYIPVKSSSAVTVKENSYDNDGAILIKDIGSTYQKQAWKDYIPVFIDSSATDAWKVDSDGFIPTFPTPSLSLDFTSSDETLDPLITFTRASNATRINSSGVVETVNNDVPRFTYDPVTKAPQGLLIEEQRTNLVLNSDTLATQNVTVAAVAHTLSFYGTGTVTLSGVSTAGPLVGTGAYPNRVTLTFTPTAGTLTLTVSGSVRFAQLEAGAFPTSYIPTTTASATRAADVATITGTNFSGFYNQNEGTLFGETIPYALVAGTSGTFPAIISVTDGTADNMIGILNDTSASSRRYFVVNVGGVAQASLNTADPSYVIGVASKFVGTYKLNDFGFSRNGEAVQTDNSGTVPTVNALYIGNRNNGNYSPNIIRKITYYPVRLSNQQLQNITS